MSDTTLLTKDTSPNLSCKALDAIPSNEKIGEGSQREGEHSESGPLLIHTSEIIAPLDSNLKTTEGAEINSYLHENIKCIVNHPFRAGTNRCL